jgi:hypothetical protein
MSRWTGLMMQLVMFFLFVSPWGLAQDPLLKLNLGSRVQPLPTANRFGIRDYFVWCGAPVKGPDDKYHLFYSRWPVQVGFAPGWAIHSEIAYAVADNPAGPYQHVNVALTPRGIHPTTGTKYWDADVTHNANAFFHEGKYYLYYMGNYGDGKSYSNHRNHQRVGLAIAEHPAGPWKRFDDPIIDITDDRTSFDSLCVTNPAACLRPDGGVLVIYKAVEYLSTKEMGGRVRFGAAIANSPEGPYVKTPGEIFEAKTNGQEWMLCEDPFIWHSRKYGNRYYAVARDVAGIFSGAKGGLCLFQSEDGLNWKPSKHSKVLGNTYALENGRESKSQLERPFVLLENDEPIYLFGAADGYLKNGKISTNVQIPIARAE